MMMMMMMMMMLQGYTSSAVKRTSQECRWYNEVLKYYPLVLVELNEKTKTQQDCVIDVLLDLLQKDVNQDVCNNTCLSLIRVLKTLDDNQLLAQSAFAGLLESLLTTQRVYIKITLMEAAQQIFEEHSDRANWPVELKMKALEVLKKVLLSSNSSKVTRSSCNFSAMLQRTIV